MVGVSLPAADSTWPIPVAAPQQRVPDRPNLAPDLGNAELPVDHARLVWFVSARELEKPGVQPMDRVALGLLMDSDLATSTAFSTPRKYEIVFDLQRTIVVNRVTMCTDVPGCPITIRVAGADLSQDQGKGWRNLGESKTAVPFTKYEFRNEPIRFIHMTIDTSNAPKGEPLKVYEFCVFGQEDVRDYVLNLLPEKDRKTRDQFIRSSSVGSFPPEMLQYDLGSLDAGSSIKHLGPATLDPKVSYMIDDDPETSWQADPAEKETLVLLDMGAERNVQKISMMHTARPGKITAYALKELPGQPAKAPQLAWLDRLTDVPLFRLAQNAPPAAGNDAQITPEWLAAQTPFGSIDTSNNNYSSVIIAGEPRAARYLVFRYQNPAPGSGDPLLINGINVLGNYPVGEFVLMPRSLPIIAGLGGPGPGAPFGGGLGLPLTEQLNDALDDSVAPPKPPPVTP